MKSKPEKKKWWRTVLSFLYLLLVLMPLLSTATYTWFALSRTPKVSDMSLYVNTPVGLEITWDPEDAESWGQHLDFAEHSEGETILKPVTWSDANQTFYAATFGADGRMNDISYELSDDRNANRDDSEGYYLKMTFYARTDENVAVELAKAEENTGTYLIGTPIWNEEEILHNDGGNGAQGAIRVGFRITKFDVDGVQSEEPVFIIYEPNANYHVDVFRDSYETLSIDGTGDLVPEERLIRQSNTWWYEVDPVQKGVVAYSYGEFTTDTHLFDLDEDCMAKIEVYIWLEGQDVDCTNEIGNEAQIFASLQFYSESRPQSGMEEIPDGRNPDGADHDDGGNRNNDRDDDDDREHGDRDHDD